MQVIQTNESKLFDFVNILIKILKIQNIYRYNISALVQDIQYCICKICADIQLKVMEFQCMAASLRAQQRTQFIFDDYRNP